MVGVNFRHLGEGLFIRVRSYKTYKKVSQTPRVKILGQHMERFT